MANNNEDNQQIPLPPHETDSQKKRKQSRLLSKKKKKKKKAVVDSTTQLVIAEDGDSDYVPDQEPKAKASSKRLWSEKDEITLLKALKLETNQSGIAELFNSVNPLLEADVSKYQTSDKVRKLKNWFNKNIVDVAPLQRHKAKLYKLCQQLWGGEDKQCDGDGDGDDDDDDDDDLDDDDDNDDLRSRSSWRKIENFGQ